MAEIDELITRPCTITRRTAGEERDRYRNKIPGTEEVDALCYIEQGRRDEPEGQGDLSSEDWWGAFLPDTEISAGDSLVVDGAGEFEVIGDPGGMWDPDERRTTHLEATLKQVDANAEGTGS